MDAMPFSPLVELTRGPLVESIHFGALAVVDASGKLLASVGDADLVANLRSTSKPFQALPLVESGGVDQFGFTEEEISITCASHHGTDKHVAVLESMQAKIGASESELQCGQHPPIDDETYDAMLLNGTPISPNRHNCSGKHTGMLAQCAFGGYANDTYLSTEHPIQKNILGVFAEMAGADPSTVLIGIDGCSAPTFAVPLRNAALAFARLSDPSGLPEKRAQALRRIFRAMSSYPMMVAGPKGFDTRLMEVAAGTIVTKGGAEGYQGIGIAAGACGAGSPALGIAYKVIDGDPSGRARAVIAMTVLRQLGALDDAQLDALAEFDTRPIKNWRKLEVGVIRPVFQIGWPELAGQV